MAQISTPPPPGRANTPPTPRHGYSDNWDQFSPRKSARLSSQRTSAAAARTPSPTPASPSRLRKQQHQQLHSPPSGGGMMSPAGSPRKKKMPPMNTNRRASGQLTAEGTANAAASLGLSAKAKGKTIARGGSNISTRAGMLPTPAKTPARKQPSAENEANIAAIARNLFHTPAEAEMFATPQKKRSKKYTGITMDSFAVVEDEEPIKIFTDSQDRIPEADHSLDNPFFGEGASRPQPDPPKRRSKRKQVNIPGEGPQDVKDATRREDGLVYVFRGKKVFRKFEDTPTASDEEGVAGATKTPSKRLTRSSIKPRLLFPVATATASTQEMTLEDEEAVTDIEVAEEEAEEETEDVPGTPLESGDDVPEPPAAPKFAPASPPMTTKAKRHINKIVETETPVKSIRKRSPFDEWRHVKKGETSTTSHKRSGSSLGSEVPAKRSRA